MVEQKIIFGPNPDTMQVFSALRESMKAKGLSIDIDVDSPATVASLNLLVTGKKLKDFYPQNVSLFFGAESWDIIAEDSWIGTSLRSKILSSIGNIGRAIKTYKTETDRETNRIRSSIFF